MRKYFVDIANQMRRFVVVMVQYTLIISGIGSLTFYLLRWWPGDSFIPVRFLNYAMPWLFGGLISMLVIALLIPECRNCRLFLAIPTLLLGLTLVPFITPSPMVEPASQDVLKVMSYNVCRPNKRITSITEVIRSVNPDLLLLQDVNPDFAENLISQVSDLYPSEDKHLAYDQASRQLIFSQFQLARQEVTWKQGRVLKVIIETSYGPIHVWNVHISQPLDWGQHDRELALLADAVQAENGRLIVAGDFNTTGQSEAYRLISRKLRDGHRDAGWGFGFTFPAPEANPRCRLEFNPFSLGPFARIDHILYSDHFSARRVSTLASSGGSDHFPVVAELSLREP